MYMITKGGWGHIRSIDQLQIISAVHMYMMGKKRGEFGDTFVWQINYNFSSTHVYDLKKGRKGGGGHIRSTDQLQFQQYTCIWLKGEIKHVGEGQ